MKPSRQAWLVGAALLLTAAGPVAAEPAARDLFAAATVPAPAAPGAPRVLGGYAKGCLAGGEALPPTGPGWQAVRLSRNRNWGHPRLVGYIERLAPAARAAGWPGLLVGDMAQPRGGPMRTGHASHQVGLDVDIWLTPMPAGGLSAAGREDFQPTSMLRPGTREVDPKRFGTLQARLIRTAASSPEVARIFVHPGIKAALCDGAAGDQDALWMRKVRPWYGHDSHFHVRLACPPGEPLCAGQEPPPPGDGCGQDLAYWLSDAPWAPKPPGLPTPPLRLADLPAACTALVDEPAGR